MNDNAQVLDSEVQVGASVLKTRVVKGSLVWQDIPDFYHEVITTITLRVIPEVTTSPSYDRSQILALLVHPTLSMYWFPIGSTAV